MATHRHHLVRWGIAGAIVAVALAAAVATATTSGYAWAATGGTPSSSWHIGYYTPSGRALSFAVAPVASNAIASVSFTKEDDTALLVTENKAKFPSLLGDLTGKSVSASFTVSGLNAGQNFTYYGEPDACGGTAVHVRYFFETSNAGGFNEAHYWWSNPVAIDLNTVSGSGTLATVPLTGANWSDYYGHFGNDPTYATGFNAAVSNVTMMGLSFGGGCFFENGVGTTDGSGTFTLNSFTAN